MDVFFVKVKNNLHFKLKKKNRFPESRTIYTINKSERY